MNKAIVALNAFAAVFNALVFLAYHYTINAVMAGVCAAVAIYAALDEG